MIDTIGVQYYEYFLSKDALSTWDRCEFRHRIWYELLVTLKNGATFHFLYYPYVLKGKPLLKVEFSLPHVVFGSNIYMIYDINGGVEGANELLRDAPGSPQVDLMEGVLYRFDICYNYQVGDDVLYYIKAFQALERSRRHTEPYTSEGVQFRNNKVVSKFYSKERERLDKKDAIGAKAAKGILRHEVELRDKKTISKLDFIHLHIATKID